ncbi:hypothetical protein [Acidithrix ferrooxidans]|uniref:Uncharacterized protein n=1 Tax=Acidithrix ferrooxidans TaxID=1280514 RepID=A0A0D8HDZ2_9ACTN|nr:hypothetical protein [Acidithrix ferrooxidans]KJF16099.1 hypothetical protein AXFE_30450 [Acidithrix ferrooxidans]
MSETRTNVTIGTSFSAKLSAYKNAKRFGLLCASLWLYSLLLLAVSLTFTLGAAAAIAISVVIGVLLFLYGFINWRNEKMRWASPSECDSSGGCGKPECDSPGASCSTKFSNEIDRRIFEMEISKLSSLLRSRIGFDSIFFALWCLIGIAIAIQDHSNTTLFGGALVSVTSLMVILGRFELSRIAFSDKK